MSSATPGSATAGPSPRPRRIASPSWLDLRLVLGVVLVLASVLIGAEVVSSASDTTATVTVTRDLAAGTVLTGDDVRIEQAQLPDSGSSRYLRRTKDAVGRRLTRPVTHGELLPAAAVAGVRAQTTLTVPLAAGAAPQLRAGQPIELWLSSSRCASVVLLPRVTVQSVHGDTSSTLGGGEGGQDVVIDVDPAQADRVIQALAIDGATVRAGVLVGSGDPSASGAPAAGQPDDLTPCASAQPTR